MKKLIKSQLFLQVIVASMVATLATAGIVAATTIGTNISTGGTLDVTGASTLTGATTLSSTLSVTATSTLNGIIIDTDKFKVEDTSGNTTVGGTLGVTGASTFTGVIGFGTASSTAGGASMLKAANINSDTGAISFADENLTTTGTLASGALTVTGNISATGNIAMATASTTSIFKSAQIQSTTGAISFDDENLTTTGILTFGNASSTGSTVTGVKLNGLTVYGNLNVTGTFTPAITSVAGNFTIGDGASASQTLTGNVSGTDTVMTFGNGDITVTTGSLTTANAFLFNTASSSLASTGSLKILSLGSDNGIFSVSATASTTGTAVLKSATINSDTGAISFGDENLATTGTLTSGAHTVTGAISATTNVSFDTASSTGIVNFAQIQSTTGAISFKDENLSTSGTLAAGNSTITGVLSASQKLGAASTTPTFQLGVGTGQATSTISMGKFCMFAEQENGVGTYLRLGSKQAANQPFATSSIPCNQ